MKHGKKSDGFPSASSAPADKRRTYKMGKGSKVKTGPGKGFKG